MRQSVNEALDETKCGKTIEGFKIVEKFKDKCYK